MADKKEALRALREAMSSYSPISEETWQGLVAITRFRALQKKTLLYSAGEVPTSYAFVYQGLIRCFVCDEKGTEYNKNFFYEGRFPGAMTALLTAQPSLLSFEAIEDSQILEIDFAAYRKLLQQREDLKMFQIHYLEHNWLLHKDAREIELVQEDASARYRRFLAEYPALVDRLPQYHIASHLGVTPTQLSRIRKNF